MCAQNTLFTVAVCSINTFIYCYVSYKDFCVKSHATSTYIVLLSVGSQAERISPNARYQHKICLFIFEWGYYYSFVVSRFTAENRNKETVIQCLEEWVKKRKKFKADTVKYVWIFSNRFCKEKEHDRLSLTNQEERVWKKYERNLGLWSNFRRKRENTY